MALLVETREVPWSSEEWARFYENCVEWLTAHIGEREDSVSTMRSHPDYDQGGQTDYIDKFLALQTTFDESIDAVGANKSEEYYSEMGIAYGTEWHFMCALVFDQERFTFSFKLALEIESDAEAVLFKLACL